MSGGSYDYLCYKIESMADDPRLTGGSPLRRAFSEHLKLIAKAAHDIEWVDSGDKGRGDEDPAIRAVLGEHAELAKLVADGRAVVDALNAALAPHE